MTMLVIGIVLIMVLFPIWPFSVKYGLWLISLWLLVALVGIIVFRLLLFCVCVIFNYHVWIFPNLFYATGILDSFLPVVEVSKGQRSWFDVCVRLLGFSLFALLCLHIYLNPTFLEGK